jgi:hypothetical protein
MLALRFNGFLQRLRYMVDVGPINPLFNVEGFFPAGKTTRAYI